MRYSSARIVGTKRRGISPVVAELMLLVIAVVAGYFLYGHVQGFMAQLSGGSKPPGMVVIDAAGLNTGSSYCVFAAIRNIGPFETTIVAFIILDPSDQSLIASNTTKVTIPPDSTIVIKDKDVCFESNIGPSGSIRLLKIVTNDGGSSTIRVRVP